MLDIIYILPIYISPIIPPYINPFFLILLAPILLPINILIILITIITGAIVLSDIFVYVNTIANINNNIRVNIKDIIMPIRLFTILLLLSIPYIVCYFFHFIPPNTIILYFLTSFLEQKN